MHQSIIKSFLTWHYKLMLCILFASLSAVLSTVSASNQSINNKSANNRPLIRSIAVLYPQSNPRITKLYQVIIKSMKQHEDVSVQALQFSSNESVAQIQQKIIKTNAHAIILLGKKGLELSSKLELNIPIVSGAHIDIKPNHSAVSLATDPEQLFHQLKKLKPSIEQVHVIYNQANSGWLINKAELAASKANITLNAIHTNSSLESGRTLKRTIKQLNTHKDAIWLAYDPILPVKPLLPTLLKKAWEKNIIIFSGNPFHVQQGTLFALFPNYSKLGKQLISLAIRINHHIQVEPSYYLNSAINTRTASHLGISLSSIQVNNYTMVFPRK